MDVILLSGWVERSARRNGFIFAVVGVNCSDEAVVRFNRGARILIRAQLWEIRQWDRDIPFSRPAEMVLRVKGIHRFVEYAQRRHSGSNNPSELQILVLAWWVRRFGFYRIASNAAFDGADDSRRVSIFAVVAKARELRHRILE